MKTVFKLFAVSTLLIVLSNNVAYGSTATQSDVDDTPKANPEHTYLRKARTDLFADEALITATAPQIPSWILERGVSIDDVVKFLGNRALRHDAPLVFSDIGQQATEFRIDNCQVSLLPEDLFSPKILTGDAIIMLDGKPRGERALVFESKVCSDVIVTLNKTGNLKQATRKLNESSETLMVQPLSSQETIFVEYSTKDQETVEIEDDKTDYPERELGALIVSDKGGSTNHIINDDNVRHLQASCSDYRVVEVALYLDSYFCALEDNDADDAIARAESIVLAASKFYELHPFCMKLEISYIVIYCNTAGDYMYPFVSAATEHICTEDVFREFRLWLGQSEQNHIKGDVKHLFSGRGFSGARCIGRAYIGSVCRGGWASGINEMSGKTIAHNLIAHEVGHNLGAGHDREGIMRASSGACSKVEGACYFSEKSQNEINGNLQKRNCVATVPAQTPNPTPAPMMGDPMCSNGIQAGNVCCAASCGVCGGSGCRNLPGGRNSCCKSRIKENGNSCNEFEAPCVIG